MSVPIIAFFNHKGGIGKTSLVYHLAWMYRDFGLSVLAVDFDPQANLTSTFLDEDRLEELWITSEQPNTIFRCLQPLIRGTGDIADPILEQIDEGIFLLNGDLQLARFEDDLSTAWPGCLDQKEQSFQTVSAFWRLLRQTTFQQHFDLILIDLGPNLSAINRSALIAADYVVIPLSTDLLSLQGLRSLGPTLQRWRREWQERLEKNLLSDLRFPSGKLQPIGYIVWQHAVRFDRPARALPRWTERIPEAYHQELLDQTSSEPVNVTTDPSCLALLKSYPGLVSMAQEAHKPIFYLKPADGAIGAYSAAILNVYGDFKQLAENLAQSIALQLP